MGWSDKGKRGIHCGRTIRRNSRPEHMKRDAVIVKYKKNTSNIPESKVKSCLTERYGLTDGLNLRYIPHITNDDGVEFSLGKRKRWLLRELQDCPDVKAYLEEEDELHLCIHERHIFYGTGRSRGDCVSVYSDRDGLKTPRHKYSYYSDIRGQAKSPEIGYEICSAPSANSWPNYKESQIHWYDRYWDVRGNKSLSKCKGQKSKIWQRLYNVDHCDELDMAETSTLSQDCKVKIINKEDFEFATNNNTDSSQRLSFSLSEFRNPASEMVNTEKCLLKSNVSSQALNKKDTKSNVIYDKNYQLKAPLTIKTQPECSFVSLHKVQVHGYANDIEPGCLAREWCQCYIEGTTSPRMFAVNITSLLPCDKLKASTISHVVFEVKNDYLEGTPLIDASLAHVTIGYDSQLEIAAKDFVSYVKRMNHQNQLFKVKDLVQSAINCIEVVNGFSNSTVPMPKKSKSVVKLNLLDSVLQGTSDVYTLDEAQQQIKEKLLKNESSATGRIEERLPELVAVECEICYTTDEDALLTILTECGHAFCNDCWAGYLETQVSQNNIKCPGYDCDCDVGQVPFMSFNPQNYERHVNMLVNKHLEISPDWKWCPGKHCQRLIKATALAGPMTVICNCSTSWCFQCQNRSHWPALCNEARKFHAKSCEIEQVILHESQETISSVMVKNCPECNYPIEKYRGCQFMHCVLCNVHFCWNCLTPASYGHKCEKSPSDDINEVFFNFNSKRFQMERFVQIVLHNENGRKLSSLFSKRKKLQKLEKSLQSYAELLSLNVGENSRVALFMMKMSNGKALDILRDAIDFEFQARFVVEGLATKAAIAKPQYRKTALRMMNQLSFITERVHFLLQQPDLAVKNKNLTSLQRFVDLGTKCIFSLSHAL